MEERCGLDLGHVVIVLLHTCVDVGTDLGVAVTGQVDQDHHTKISLWFCAACCGGRTHIGPLRFERERGGEGRGRERERERERQRETETETERQRQRGRERERGRERG